MGTLTVFATFCLTCSVICRPEEADKDIDDINLTDSFVEMLTNVEKVVSEDSILPRIEKSLLNSFPFNVQNQEAAHQEHADHDHDHDKAELTFNISRQYGGNEEEYSPTFNEIADAEKKCIDKIMLVEETQYDTVITCDHSYDQRCHTSYKTGYESVQEEECEENFRKVCFIEMVVIAFNETQDVCKKPLVKDCDVEGEQICRTEYQSECWTKQIAHEVEDDVPECKTVNVEMCKDETVGYTSSRVCEDWPHEECQITKKKVTKYTPMTGCEKVPTKLCAPTGCGFKEGPEECHPVTKTVVAEKPEETCTLEPQRTCKHVTRLVPKLTPTQECVDVPKEVCTRSKINPRKVKKPVVKKWCYVPSEESGLA